MDSSPLLGIAKKHEKAFACLHRLKRRHSGHRSVKEGREIALGASRLPLFDNAFDAVKNTVESEFNIVKR